MKTTQLYRNHKGIITLGLSDVTCTLTLLWLCVIQRENFVVIFRETFMALALSVCVIFREN